MADTVSRIKLDELSSFEATKKNRAPFLIKFGREQDRTGSMRHINSIPGNSEIRCEADWLPTPLKLVNSLPERLAASACDKENVSLEKVVFQENDYDDEYDHFQDVDSTSSAQGLDGNNSSSVQSWQPPAKQQPIDKLANYTSPSSQLGNSYIDLIVKLKVENQNLIRALETNKGVVKNRLGELKESLAKWQQKEIHIEKQKVIQKQETSWLQTKNSSLEQQLEIMQARLKDLGDTLKSTQDEHSKPIYPSLGREESFHNPALSDTNSNSDEIHRKCDQLERQLDEIGVRSHESSLLRQEVNILRQGVRSGHLSNIVAKSDLDKLESQIQRLRDETKRKETEPKSRQDFASQSSKPALAARAAAEAVLSKYGDHIGRRAVKSAAKAAKHAAKQAYREEKAAARAKPSAPFGETDYREPDSMRSHGRRNHDHKHYSDRSSSAKVKDEIVSDLWSTANRVMLTGYKVASTHVNLALDKLSQFEQSQATKLSTSKDSKVTPSAPPNY